MKPSISWDLGSGMIPWTLGMVCAGQAFFPCAVLLSLPFFFLHTTVPMLIWTLLCGLSTPPAGHLPSGVVLP